MTGTGVPDQRVETTLLNTNVSKRLSIESMLIRNNENEDHQILRMNRSLLDDDEEEEEGEATEEAFGQAGNNASLIASNRTGLHSRHRHHTLSVSTHTWDGFVRHGARFKTFLDGAMQQVRASSGPKRSQESVDNEDHDEPLERPHRRRRVLVEDQHTTALAREKVSVVLELEQQLKDAQAQATALKAANESMREDFASNQQRLDRTVEALRLAGSNASNARADAEAAEATAANLAQTLQSLQTVVSETKRAAQVLHAEHQEVADAAASVEARIVQKEADLARSLKEVKSLRKSNDELEASRQAWEEKRDGLERSVEAQKLELNRYHRESKEREALELARKERADKVERELHAAQTMLVEATTGQAHAEETKIALEETLAGLQKANKDLHQHLSKVQETATKECDRLTEALSKAEKEVQELRIDAEAKQEELRRHEIDKEGAEKQISQLKGLLSSMERHLQNTSPGQLSPQGGTESNPSDASSSFAFTLPSFEGDPLELAQSGPSSNAPGRTCSICFKASFGIMKACQCGKPLCNKRAHVSCANRIQPGPSVSHPGTPAPRLPIVLCAATRRPLVDK